MQIFFLVLLCLLWMIFWSFSSVLISRLYTKEWWIAWWRSHCTECKHELWVFDLFPVFSYVFLLWKCRYCKTKIHYSYPLLELVMWIGFILVWLFLVNYELIFLWNISEIIKLIFFLYSFFVIIVFSAYDIKYKLIPTEILWYSLLIMLFLLIASHFSAQIASIFSYFIPFENELLNKPLINALLGSLAIYSFLYIQIFLFGVFYAFKKKKYKLILDRLIDYLIIPFYILLSWFYEKKEEKSEEEEQEEDRNTWVWYWDLWIAIFMWFVWWFKIAILWLILAYLIWSIIWVYIIILKRVRKIEWVDEIAFWPFLWVWLIISLIFYHSIIDFAINILWLRI